MSKVAQCFQPAWARRRKGERGRGGKAVVHGEPLAGAKHLCSKSKVSWIALQRAQFIDSAENRGMALSILASDWPRRNTGPWTSCSAGFQTCCVAGLPACRRREVKHALS